MPTAATTLASAAIAARERMKEYDSRPKKKKRREAKRIVATVAEQRSEKLTLYRRRVVDASLFRGVE